MDEFLSLAQFASERAEKTAKTGTYDITVTLTSNGDENRNFTVSDEKGTLTVKYKDYDVSVGENTNILSYTDAESISEYAVEAVQYVLGAGLMKGRTETTINPKDNATRAEIAAILQRFIETNN